MWFFDANASFINKGKITEMFVGQELQAYANPMFEKKLYYWKRQARGAVAELDYLVDYQHQVIPIEVKSGSSKKLKSMYSFLNSHEQSTYGIRYWHSDYGLENNIHSYPLFAIANLLMSREYMDSFA